MEHSHTHSPGSLRPRNTDAHQDQRILRAAVAAPTVSREEIRAPFAPAVLPRTIGNRLLVVGLRSRVPPSGYHLDHDTAKHGYTDAVKESTGEWNGALLSSVMRVNSVCMRVVDVHLYSVDLVSLITRSALLHDQQAHLKL